MAIYESYIRAGNPTTPVEELRELIREASARIKQRLAGNPSTPSDLLERLATDDDPEVRVAVGRNQNTPIEMRERLAADESPQVRFGMAGDNEIPLPILHQLAVDDNAYVQDRAKRTLEGLALEDALKAASFVHYDGEEGRLGEILEKTGLLTATQVEDILQISKQNGLPLGRTIAQLRVLSRPIIVMALEAQVKIRKRESSLDDAVVELRAKLRMN